MDDPFLFKLEIYELFEDIELIKNALETSVVVEFGYFFDGSVITSVFTLGFEDLTFST